MLRVPDQPAVLVKFFNPVIRHIISITVRICDLKEKMIVWEKMNLPQRSLDNFFIFSVIITDHKITCDKYRFPADRLINS